ncbi:MAG: cardiolipin synthase [Phycisphaerae bacterium]|nr:cardiolipin synthase [Phycisphaerae bacterium]
MFTSTFLGIFSTGFWFFLVEFVLRLGMILFLLLQKKKRPSVLLAWILLILAFPIIGLLAYPMFGGTRLGRRRMNRHRMILDQIDKPEFHLWNDPRPHQIELNESEQQLSRLAETVSRSPASSGNRLKLFGCTDEVIKQLVMDIDVATDHVHMCFYIYLDDMAGTRVGQALERAVQRGVDCRLLVDGAGSKAFLRSRLRRRLVDSGIQGIAAMPVNWLRLLFSRIDLRNHRKIVVIDGKLGWTGSQNIAEASFAPKKKYAPWVDCMVRADGPVVRELQLIFTEDWYLDSTDDLDEQIKIAPTWHEDGIPAQVMATGPNFYNEATTQIIQASIQLARHEVFLTTPYFVPDEGTFMSIIVAARRGVDVQIVMPSRNDSKLVGAASRSFYQPMLKAGVRIHEYTKGLLHAKTITIDKDLAVVTSANLDRRSFSLNFEAGLLVYDTDFASQLRFLQGSYVEDSIPVNKDEWMKRSWARRLGENTAGILSPLL